MVAFRDPLEMEPERIDHSPGEDRYAIECAFTVAHGHCANFGGVRVNGPRVHAVIASVFIDVDVPAWSIEIMVLRPVPALYASRSTQLIAAFERPTSRSADRAGA